MSYVNKIRGLTESEASWLASKQSLLPTAFNELKFIFILIFDLERHFLLAYWPAKRLLTVSGPFLDNETGWANLCEVSMTVVG